MPGARCAGLSLLAVRAEVLSYEILDHVETNRFDEDRIHTGLDGVLAIFAHGHCRDGNQQDIAVVLSRIAEADGAGHVDPGHPRHDQVEKHNGVMVFAKKVESLFRVRNGIYLDPESAEHCEEQGEARCVVVDYQHATGTIRRNLCQLHGMRCGKDMP